MINFSRIGGVLPVFFFFNTAISQIPVAQEPHHKIVFQNEYVRVIDLHIPAGDTTSMHTHSAASIVVFLSESALAIQNAGAPAVVTQVHRGDVVYRAYDEHPVTHRVWSQGDSMFHCLVVELVNPPPGSDTCAIASGTFQWRQKSVSAYKLDIPSGIYYHLPGSACAYFLIDFSGNITTVSSHTSRSLCAGDYAFFPPQSNIEIGGSSKENTGCVLVLTQSAR